LRTLVLKTTSYSQDGSGPKGYDRMTLVQLLPSSRFCVLS